MKSLDKKLAAWVTARLISPQQADDIQTFERQSGASHWMLYGFLFLGVFVLSMGVISLIAANWKDIPDSIKLLTDFIVLLGVGSWAVIAGLRQSNFHEGILFGFMMLVLATIGLISQIYHLSGEPYQAFLLWGMITLPIVLLSERSFVTGIWVFLVVISLYQFMMDYPIVDAMLQFTEQIFAVFIIVPILIALSEVIAVRLRAHQAMTSVLRLAFLLSFLCALAVTDFKVTFPLFNRLEWTHALLTQIVAGVAVLGALGVVFVPTITRSQRILLSLVWLFSILLCVFALHQSTWKIAGAVLAILSLMALLLYYGSRHDFVFYQFIALLIGLRFLLLYFTELGGLMNTGFGLIITGFVIIAMVALWRRYQSRLVLWLDRIDHVS